MTNNNKFSFSYTHSSHSENPVCHPRDVTKEIKYKTIINEMKINCLFVYICDGKAVKTQNAKSQTKGKKNRK